MRHQENEQRRKANKPLLPEKIQDISLDIEAAVWAWINFGGIGARTRRGCGALFCPKVQPEAPSFHPPSIDDFTQWFKGKAEQKDKVVFTSRKRGVAKLQTKSRANVIDTWRKSQGLWAEHPVFHGMNAKGIIEWLRGDDADV